MKNSFFKLSFIAIVFLVGCLTFSRKNASELFNSGVKLDSSYEYKKAIKYYDVAIKKDPTRYEFYLKRAEATYKAYPDKRGNIQVQISEDYNSAVRCANSADLSDSIFYSIYLSRLQYHYEFLQYQVVLDQANIMIRDYPNSYGAYLYKGMALLNLGKEETATLVLDSAYVKASNIDQQVDVLKRRAQLEYYKGLFRQSINHYQQMDTVRKLLNTELVVVSRAYWQLQKKDSACLYFNKTVNSNSKPTGMDAEINNYCNSVKK